MFSSGTIGDLIAFVFGTGSAIAVLLQRIPGWDKLPGWAAKLIVAGIGVFSPMALILLKAYLPPDVLKETGGQLLSGVAIVAASYVAHLIDQFLQGLSASAKLKIAEYKAAK